MFDRWRKLLKAFHNEKKKQYDISKIPDIYDSAKYDAIHSSHLPLDLEPVYKVNLVHQLNAVVDSMHAAVFVHCDFLNRQIKPVCTEKTRAVLSWLLHEKGTQALSFWYKVMLKNVHVACRWVQRIWDRL